MTHPLSARAADFGLRFENGHLVSWQRGRLNLPWALGCADLLVSVLQPSRVG